MHAHCNFLWGSIRAFASGQPAARPATTFVLILALLFVIATVAVVLRAAWKVFKKAHRPGWAALIPLYSSWTFAKIGGRPGWWGLNPLLNVIPVVGWITSLVMSAMVAVSVAHRFGKSTAFGIFFLWVFTPIGYLILAYGDSRYLSAKHAAALRQHQSFGAPDKPSPVPKWYNVSDEDAAGE